MYASVMYASGQKEDRCNYCSRPKSPRYTGLSEAAESIKTCHMAGPQKVEKAAPEEAAPPQKGGAGSTQSDTGPAPRFNIRADFYYTF